MFVRKKFNPDNKSYLGRSFLGLSFLMKGSYQTSLSTDTDFITNVGLVILLAEANLIELAGLGQNLRNLNSTGLKIVTPKLGNMEEVKLDI